MLDTAKSTATMLLHSLLVRGISPRVGETAHTLGEIDMNSVVVDEDALHFEIRLFAGGLVFKFDEGVLKTVASAFVADDFAGEDAAEARED